MCLYLELSTSSANAPNKNSWVVLKHEKTLLAWSKIKSPVNTLRNPSQLRDTKINQVCVLTEIILFTEHYFRWINILYDMLMFCYTTFTLHTIEVCLTEVQWKIMLFTSIQMWNFSVLDLWLNHMLRIYNTINKPILWDTVCGWVTTYCVWFSTTTTTTTCNLCIQNINTTFKVDVS